MKRAILASAISASAILSSHPANAQLAVVCVQCATEFTTILAWAQQLINDAKDLGLADIRNGTLGDTLQSLTGVRDPGSALRAMQSLGIQNPLPPDAQQVISAVTGMAAGATGADTAGQIIAETRGLLALQGITQQLYDAQAQGLQQLNRARGRLATAVDPADKADAQSHIQLATSDGVRQNTQGGSVMSLTLISEQVRTHNAEMSTRKELCDYINQLRSNEDGTVPDADCSQYPLIDSAQSASVTSANMTVSAPGGGTGAQNIVYSPTMSGSSPMQQMLAQSWGQQAADNATALGVNPTALAATGVIESNLQPGAVSPTGPTGVWQMTNGTYQSDISQVAQAHPDLAGQLSSDRTNPASQSAAAAQELANNAQQLQAAGIDNPTVLDTRGAYQFGAGYGVQLAKADAATPMSSIVPQSALGPNGASNMTVGQWRQSVSAKIGNDAANAPVLLPSNT